MDSERISQSKIAVIVRRLLRKHDFPPDKQEKATPDRPRTSRAIVGRLGWASPNAYTERSTSSMKSQT